LYKNAGEPEGFVEIEVEKTLANIRVGESYTVLVEDAMKI